MKSAALYKCIYHHAKGIAGCCEKSAKHYDVETIHQLRVHFKQLRALLRWQYAGHKKLVQPLKKIYNTAGQVRTIDLVMEYMHQHKVRQPLLYNWLQQQHRRSLQQLRGSYKPHAFAGWLQKVKQLQLQYHPHTSFFNSYLAGVDEIIKASKPADEALHKARKKIKDMQYAAAWCRKYNFTLPLLQPQIVTILQRSAAALGRYNDYYALEQVLQKYLVQQKHHNEMVQTARLLKRIVVAKQQLYTRVLSSLKRRVAQLMLSIK
jgi:CHAD domain-containing protein